MQGYIEKTFNTYIHSSPSIGLIALIDLDNDEALISSERLTRADLDDVLTPLTTWRRSVRVTASCPQISENVPGRQARYNT